MPTCLRQAHHLASNHAGILLITGNKMVVRVHAGQYSQTYLVKLQNSPSRKVFRLKPFLITDLSQSIKKVSKPYSIFF